MLTQFTLENFKAFTTGDPVRLAPITLIYGPNSSGKSSIIQSLLLLRQSISGKIGGNKNDLIIKGDYVDLGNFTSLINQHDTSKTLKIGFRFGDGSENLNYSKISKTTNLNPFNGIDMSFKAVHSSSSKRHVIPILSTVDLHLKNHDNTLFNLTLNRPEAIDSSEDFPLNSDDDFLTLEDEFHDILHEVLNASQGNEYYKFSSQSDLGELRDFLCYWSHVSSSTHRVLLPFIRENLFNDFDLPYLLNKVLVYKNSWKQSGIDFIPASIQTTSTNIIYDNYYDKPLEFALNDILKGYDRVVKNSIGKLTYLGPLRMHPARHYLLNGVPGQSVGPAGEQTVQILYHDASTFGNDNSLLKKLNSYCREFGIPYHFNVKNIGNSIIGDVIVFYLTDIRTNVRVAPSDVGFGIGQLLPIIVEGILANERGQSPRLVCVEQPEIHIHPRLQAIMADFFINTSLIKNKKSGVQWILETHSESLMLRLQRRIRDKTIKPEDICVLYVDHQGERGSSIQELRLDECGEFIDLWPDGFFVENYTEMMWGH